MLLNHSTEGLSATSYIKMMPHTTAVNLCVFFGLRGRVITTSSACTSGSQGIGYAYESIRMGKQIAMVAGGADELSPTQTAVFDTLYATSTRNDEPHLTPRPFDADRDGLVVGEGAAHVHSGGVRTRARPRRASFTPRSSDTAPTPTVFTSRSRNRKRCRPAWRSR